MAGKLNLNSGCRGNAGLDGRIQILFFRHEYSSPQDRLSYNNKPIKNYEITVRPNQSSKKVLWLCIKNKLPYIEFYADSEIYRIKGGCHKSYNIKFVWGTSSNTFE